MAGVAVGDGFGGEGEVVRAGFCGYFDSCDSGGAEDGDCFEGREVDYV